MVLGALTVLPLNTTLAITVYVVLLNRAAAVGIAWTGVLVAPCPLREDRKFNPTSQPCVFVSQRVHGQQSHTVVCMWPSLLSV
jgi:hypothetical protein